MRIYPAKVKLYIENHNWNFVGRKPAIEGFIVIVITIKITTLIKEKNAQRTYKLKKI